MSSVSESAQQHQDPIVVGAEDLPVFCPGPKSPLWSMHPRTYIEVVKNGVAKCQYCGAEYVLRDGDHPHGHEQAGIRL
ncbi:zinc-finger domain-containing protein [Castellaniella sp. MT123]|uniref:zinc-finger domain-containing protein n=1 Tax=Castellaniella sp. MT123 TaxID=3140381 RepID=UPI0031F46A3A